MIPKIIWQTYKDPFDTLQPYMVDTVNSWKDKNPDYEYRYMDDVEVLKFVRKEFGEDWYQIFIDCPLGVMRADIWRYMIIYKYGGVYTDLDTLCLAPIDEWLPKDYDMVICPENDVHLCQWTFAATPGHPILKSVLDCIKEGFENPDYQEDHYVHKLTGPAVWTRGIRKAIDLPENTQLIYMDKIIKDLPKAKEYKLFSFGSESWRMFHNMVVQHLYGSQNWHYGYVQWIQNIPYSIHEDIAKIQWEDKE